MNPLSSIELYSRVDGTDDAEKDQWRGPDQFKERRYSSKTTAQMIRSTFPVQKAAKACQYKCSTVGRRFIPLYLNPGCPMDIRKETKAPPKIKGRIMKCTDKYMQRSEFPETSIIKLMEALRFSKPQAKFERAGQVVASGIYGHGGLAMITPETPLYFSKASGSRFVDLDGSSFID